MISPEDICCRLRGVSPNWEISKEAADYIEALAARLADATKEADAWRANARDSGEEARKYKARLAQLEKMADVVRLDVQWQELVSEKDRYKVRLAEAEAARLITRATLTDVRRFVVMVCGETAPYAKIMLERIDKALADSQHRPADSANPRETDDASS